MDKKVKPSIFTYEDYRSYLKDQYEYLKLVDLEFSYRVFSARSGFKSSNFIKLLIDGKRQLSLKGIQKISKGLNHNEEEHSFFKSLVMLNQSKSSIDANKYAKELFKSQVFKELYPLKQAQMDFYNRWYCIPIRELIGDPNFKEDSKWISQLLFKKVTPDEVKAAIQTLTVLGLVKRQADGTLVQSDPNITTGHEAHSSSVASFHKEMIKMAAGSIDEITRMHREISSTTLLLSYSQFVQLKTMIQTFRQSLLLEASSERSMKDAVAVYQINFQLYPLSQFFPESE